MTEENIEQSMEEKYRLSIISEIKRLNSNYEGIEELTVDALESIRNMEIKRQNTTPEKAFKDIRTPAAKPDTQKVENEAPVNLKFNRLQIFHPQFAPSESMAKYKENCTILRMMINPDPRFPEWQVS